MKKRRILISIIILVTIIAANLLPLLSDALGNALTAEAGVAEELMETEVAVPSWHIAKDRTKELGTAENPFIVLEIVPYEGYAEIGYLIGGCEPVDFEKVKYVGSMTEANNFLVRINSIIGGEPFSVEEVKKYVDYYRNEDYVPEEDYPEGYLEQFEKKCYGYFQRVEDGGGSYSITGGINDMSLAVSYCGNGGNYNFVSEYEVDKGRTDEGTFVPSEYLNNFKRVSDTVIEGEGTIMVSRGLSDGWSWGTIYACYNGVYGYFRPVNWGEVGDFQIDGNLNNENLVLTYCGSGGNYTFIEKEGDSSSVYDRFDENGILESKLCYRLGMKDTVLSYTKHNVPQQDTIQISYANSSEEHICAAIRSFAPLEYHYTNENYFLKRCLYVPEDSIEDYHIQVITVTPETLEVNQDLIAAADFINITDANHVASALETWAMYYSENLFSPSEEEIQAILNGSFTKRTFLEHDLSWDVTVKLLCKISIDDEGYPHAPLSIAVSCYQIPGLAEPYKASLAGARAQGIPHAYIDGEGIINNVAKLYMMLLAFELEDEEEESGYFYRNYIETGLVTGREVTLNGKTVTTGCFNNILEKFGESEEALTAALYWNPYTFITMEGHEVWDGDCDPFADSNLLAWPNIIGGDTNYSVRNNVFTYNSDCSLTQHAVDDGFEFKENEYHWEPFQLIEFCEREQLANVDIIYYLLHQKSTSLGMTINGSDKNQIYSNVDYDSEVPETAIAGEIITGEDGKLYGRVHFNISLASNMPLANSQAEIIIYRDPSYNKAETSEREDMITISEAYLSDGTLERLQLYTDYYYDVPLDLLQTSNTEELKFSVTVYYRYKGEGAKDDPDSYSMEKKMYELKLDKDGNVTKDNRRSLTFVRRALFDLE